MPLNLNFSLLKLKSGFKSLEHKLPISPARRSSSAWSYSYDLKLLEICEKALNLPKKYEYSETDVEDKLSSRSDLDADLDNDFIFQGNRQINDHAMAEGLRSRASDVSNNIRPRSLSQYRQCSPRNDLKPTRKVSFEESLNNVKRLRLSDMQNQRSWLGRITRPILEDISDEMKPKKKKGWNISQNQVIVDYLLQFIQKTALPAIQRFEQLQEKYFIEEEAWKNQVEFLERQNSLLKSDLQNADKACRDAEKELTNLKKIYSQNQLRTGVKGNFEFSVPASNEITRNFDWDLEAQDMPDVKQKCSASELKFAVEMEECTDLESESSSLLKNLELERIATENENQINYENSPEVKEILYPEDSLNLEWKCVRESMKSKNISRNSKNTTVRDGAENVEVGNPSLEKKGAIAQHVDYIEDSSSEENSSLFGKLDDVKSVKVMSGVRAYSDQRRSGKRIVKDEAREYRPYVKGGWGSSCKVSLSTGDLLELKEQRLPRTVLINPHVLSMIDSCYLQNQDEAASTLSRGVLKVKKERRSDDSPRITPVPRAECVNYINQYRPGGGRSKKSMFGTAVIRSRWV